jgi:hypothetical protein
VYAQAEAHRARDALLSLDPGCDRDTWVRALMAAKAADVPEDDAIAWSAGAANFSCERDVRSVWRSIKPAGGIGPGTLFAMARDSGWKDDNDRSRAPRTKAAPKVERPSAQQLWQSLQPAPEDHPYIVAKSGTAEGLRIFSQTERLQIAGMSVAGWLAVPVIDDDGAVVSIQCVPPPGEGRKLNLPGCPMKGTFVVGEMTPGGTAYVVEGIGQAWACWKATGHPAVVTFGAGRMRAVAEALRARDRPLTLVLVPDTGKEADAEAIAADVHAKVVPMPAGSPPNFDANDFAQLRGHDELEVLLSNARDPALRYRLLGTDDIRRLPPLEWRCRGVAPAQGILGIVGQSGAAKSFLGFDMLAACAEGREWFGRRVPSPTPVIILPLEGQSGMRQRAMAWEARYQRPLPPLLRLVLQPFHLTDPVDVDDLARAALQLGERPIIAIDTLNAAAPEIDENGSDGMGLILDGAKRLQAATGGLVVLVHHLGKDPTKGPRGHSSFFAALDSCIEVLRDGEQRRQWRISKSKDGADDSASYPFRLDVVDLGVDEHGDELTSCVIAPVREEETTTREYARQPGGGSHQKVMLDGLGPLLRASRDFGKSGAPPTRPCLEIEKAIDQLKSRLVCDEKRRTERAREAIRGLIGRGLVGHSEGWIWLT